MVRCGAHGNLPTVHGYLAMPTVTSKISDDTGWWLSEAAEGSPRTIAYFARGLLL